MREENGCDIQLLFEQATTCLNYFTNGFQNLNWGCVQKEARKLQK